MNEPLLLSLSQIALRAGVTPAAVSNWRRRYPESFPKPVSHDRFLAEDIDEWLIARGASRKVRSEGLGRGSWQCVELLLQGGLDQSSSIAATASLISLLTAPGSTADQAIENPRIDLLQLAGLIESEQGWPTGCLAIPLRPLQRIEHSYFLDAIGGVRADLSTGSGKSLFTKLLDRADSRGFLQEAQTPPVLSKFLARLSPRKAGSVLDPACGTGSLLAAAAKQTNAPEVMGWDVNEVAWALCVQRMILQGLPFDQIKKGSAFEPTSLTAELVVSTPPLGMRLGAQLDDSHALRKVEILSKSGDAAWLHTCRQLLAKGGTAIVVTTPAPAFNIALRSFRHELVRSGSLAALIALPGGLVHGTSIPVAVWIMSAADNVSPPPVLMINATETGEPRNRALEDALREYRAWRDQGPGTFRPRSGFSALVPVLDLLPLEGDVDLSPQKWTSQPVDPGAAAHALELAALDLNEATREARTLRFARLTTRLGRPRDFISALEHPWRSWLTFDRGRTIPSIERDTMNGKHPYVVGVGRSGLRTSGFVTGQLGRVVVTRVNDVVVNTVNSVHAAVDDDGGNALAGTLWRVRLAADSPLSPASVALLINSQRINSQTVGTTVQRLRHPKELLLPILEEEEIAQLNRLSGLIHAAQRTARRLALAATHTEAALADAVDAGVRVKEGRPHAKD